MQKMGSFKCKDPATGGWSLVPWLHGAVGYSQSGQVNTCRLKPASVKWLSLEYAMRLRRHHPDPAPRGKVPIVWDAFYRSKGLLEASDMTAITGRSGGAHLLRAVIMGPRWVQTR